MFIKYILPLLILSGCGKPSSNDSHHSGNGSGDEYSAELCVSDFRVLPVYSNVKNYLAFENFGSRGIGRCRGHSLVTQKMEMLAKFRKNEPHPCRGMDEPTCYGRLSQLVNNILNGNITVIGGHDSLFSFSSHPLVQKILRSKVASISHRYSASDARLESYEDDSENLNVFKDIIRRLKLRHRPYVAIQGKNRIGDHAVIAYKSKMLKNSRIVCVRDPNIVIRDSFENCQNYFYKKDGEVYYHQINNAPDEELLSASLQTDEDERVKDYIKVHYQNCISRSLLRGLPSL